MAETHSKYFFIDSNESQLKNGSDIIIITDNFSTPENIGSIIRLAANVNASKVIVIGSEACRQSKVKKTAGAAIGHVKVVWQEADDFTIPEEYELVALETAEGAEDIYNCKLPLKMAIVLGNEKYGISQPMLDACKKSIYIPMPGAIKSMNVSHAAAVCIFEWFRQNKG
ncbi:TrmH family RNA methyltransferase [Carboxylicivirga marina]|uniref:RNA methyltransferase n=1 Tax=Carboxylicivirga marina TaxID=2800988 RepID=A0ABS1HME6_9BACT|nr:RNA methyltransferase [Carboxylicivirga marina]MBK3518843.1 RNA methyltransferase [Carboxylicivirga marina]